jgi:uncharacterized protein DUF4241
VGCYGPLVAKTKALVKKKPATKPAAKPAAKKAPPPPPKKLPAVAKKPARGTKPSLPLPPPPPPPPPTRDEFDADRDIGRLLRYGEKFGAKKIDVRMLQLALPVGSGSLAICDAGVPKTFKVFDRPTGSGVFRVMLSVARTPDKGKPDKEQLAAVVIHVGRPPIAKWTIAHAKGQKAPKSEEQIPQWAVTTGAVALVDAGSGSPGALAVPAMTGVNPVELPLVDGRRALVFPSGNGEFTAYWAIDAADKPVCLVIDFDVLTQKDWKAKPV